MSELTEYSPNRMLLESVVSPLWPCEPLQPYANETPWTPSPPYTQAAIDRTHTPTLTPARLPGGVHSPLTHPSPPPKLTLFSFTEHNPSFASTRALDSHNTLAPSSVSRSGGF